MTEAVIKSYLRSPLVIVNVQLCHSENNLGLGRGPNLDKEIGSMTDPDWSVSQVEWCWLVINLPN